MINLDNVSSFQIDGQAVTGLAINGVSVWSAWKNRFIADIIANAEMTGTLAKGLNAKINSLCDTIANVDANAAKVKKAVSTANSDINTTAKVTRTLAKQTNATAKQNIETMAHFISVAYGLPSADILLSLDTIVPAKTAQAVKGNSVFTIKQDAEVSAKPAEVKKTKSIETDLTVSSAQTAKSIDKVNHGAITTETQINSVCKASAIVPQKIKANGIIDIETTVKCERPQLDAPTISVSGTTLSITNPLSNGDNVTAYKIYINGSLYSTVTTKTVDLSSATQTSASVTVRCSGNLFEDSLDSNAETLRAQYTITFYDGDTVLSSSSVGYGLTPTVPSTLKDGYTFNYWCSDSDLTTETTVGAVTGAKNYYGKWSEVIEQLIITYTPYSASLKSPYLCLGINGKVTVDWGDGSALDEMSGTSVATKVFKQHVYANVQEYTIKVTPNPNTTAKIFYATSSYSGASSALLCQSPSPDAATIQKYYSIQVTDINIPDWVTQIEMWGLTHLGISSLITPKCLTNTRSITKLPYLTTVTISKEVSTIDRDFTFVGCPNLTSVNVSEENTKFDSRDNCNAIIETAKNSILKGISTSTIPDSVTSIGNYAFSECTELTSITIPDSVTSIGSNAFYKCTGLTSITIPDSVTSIGSNAFYNCTGLTSITIPDSVTSIETNAFRSCTNLATVAIGTGVENIGAYAFAETNISDITIDTNNTTYYVDCYCVIKQSTKELVFGCKNSTIPDGVTSIGTGAFYYCSALTSITIPDNVTSIGSSAFSGCSKLTSATFAVTTGWKAGSTALTSENLSNTSTAANYLKNTYKGQKWTRS